MLMNLIAPDVLLRNLMRPFIIKDRNGVPLVTLLNPIEFFCF